MKHVQGRIYRRRRKPQGGEERRGEKGRWKAKGTKTSDRWLTSRFAAAEQQVGGFYFILYSLFCPASAQFTVGCSFFLFPSLSLSLSVSHLISNFLPPLPPLSLVPGVPLPRLCSWLLQRDLSTFTVHTTPH